MTRPFIPILRGFFFLLLSYLRLPAQNLEVPIQRTSTPIQVDGQLLEAAWEDAIPVSNFQRYVPANSGAASEQTEVRMLFDQRFLYVAALCRQTRQGEFVVQSLKRDFAFTENDAFDIYIDAFGDGITGLAFGVNPYGAQRDGIIPQGGTKDIDLTWDNRWFAEVSHNEEGWIVEMAIPFKSLRFRRSQRIWRVNFARSTLQHNEISTWAPVDRGNLINTLALMGHVQWESPPPQVGRNIALVPYLATKAEKDQQSGYSDLRALTGLDAKLGIGSALHFDLTVNPDFSQVEVDEQVIDLNRFELFFPEKRLLFLENSDLFSTLGNSRVRPFFSRRIGSLDQKPVPILFGGRLSGKLGRSWKIGLMDVQTKGSADESNPAQNYLVATVQKSLFSSSSLTAFLTNRQQVQGYDLVPNDFTRIGGLEFDYRSRDSKITGKSFLHYTFSPGQPKDAVAFSSKLRYRSKTFSVFAGIDGVGENYIPDMGFVPRLYHYDQERDTSLRVPYLENRFNSLYRFFPQNNRDIDFLGTELRLRWFTDPQFRYQEHIFKWKFLANFINQSQLSIIFSDYSQLLLFPFTLDGLDRSFAPDTYHNQRFTISYDTGKRQSLHGKAQMAYGGEFLGRRLNVSGELNYRYFQYLVLGFNYSFQRLHQFPEDFGDANFTLIGSQLEWSFNRQIFLTTFLQYNTQSQNFNINGRFNWRFNPLSDLYIVYTSNYLSDEFLQKDRALVLKVNYWLNL